MSDEGKLLESLVDYLSDGQKHALRIYGHGASGKSTFARKLQLALDEEGTNLLETDPYVITGEHRDLLSAKDFPHQKVTACIPAVHELSSLERDICALQSGLDILTIGKAWSPSLRLSAQKPILIVEGMSAAFLPKGLFDLSICFYTDEEIELGRRLARDVAVRERRPEWIEQTHLDRREQYQHFYQLYLVAADLVICQSDNSFRIEKDSTLL
ncbi:phosphoribulokinase [Streptococcus cristatus]|uniref:Phosphoribulokinase n=1 Tax=Streptococcus cristatus TaxID=45634 RepID=A0A5B0DA28_STRCR|nr:phosphoribulokinase [Streptococcus cristatus]KAA0963427.1 phosphoribulokinase [Streptococcus cristatus]